jgi:ADP-ribosylglycohydrolase
MDPLPTMAGSDSLYNLLTLEIRQRTEEGCLTQPDDWHARLRDIGPDRIDDLTTLSKELAATAPADDFPFSEPAGLDAIRHARPNGVRDMAKELTERDLLERIHGAWIGRCCGCSLGRPFDRAPFTRHPENHQRETIQFWLEGANAWPLANYVPGKSRTSRRGIVIGAPESTLEQIKAMEPDPHITSALLALGTLERKGLAFTSADIAKTWLRALPLDMAPPAETQALANMAGHEALSRATRDSDLLDSLDWREIAVAQNPYREGNGAMDRAIVFGLVCPGRPEQAAEMAWRDARVSHTRNGIYAAMFIAALTAAAFHESDLALLVDCALSEIPARCRLTHAVKKMPALAKPHADWEGCWDALMTEFGAYEPDHAILSTLVVLMALSYGAGDFTRGLSIAAGSGLSPAANGATVGSILGIRTGSRAIPAHWTTPLRNALRSPLAGQTRITISDVAQRCFRLANS